MPAAIPIAIGVSGAMGLYGAKKQADAGKQAAQVQTDYGNKALDLQKQMYEQDRADQAPYRNIAYGALNTLGSMMGPSFNAGGGGFRPSMGGQPSGSANGAPPMAQGLHLGSTAPPSPMTPQDLPAPVSVGSGMTPAAAANGGDTVLMRAPNGATARIPRDQVSHYAAKGATVLG